MVNESAILEKKARRSHRENVKHLDSLISGGKLNQYFSLSKDSLESLASAFRSKSTDDIEAVLESNVTTNGEGIKELLGAGYDAQIEAIAKSLIEEELDRIEAEAVQSFGELDSESVGELIKSAESLAEISGLKRRDDKILKQLKEALLKLTIPENLEKVAIGLAEQKGKNPEDIKKVKVVDKWGRSGKKAVVIWGSKGVLAVDYIEKSIPKSKKPKLSYVPTKEEFQGKTRDEILSRKNKPFSLKERNFVKSRSKKSKEDVLEDYQRTFGKVRTKRELNKLIKEYG